MPVSSTIRSRWSLTAQVRTAAPSLLFFTVSEDDVVLADKFCERSYNDKIHLVIAIDFTATRQIIRQLHDSLISFDRAI